MYSNNHMNKGCGSCSGCSGSSSHGGARCFSLGPFRGVEVECLQKNPIQNTGSIIPFSSGITPVALATTILGVASTGSLVGFGTAIPSVSVLGNTIDLTGILNEAFVVPRAGNITAISASFTATVGLNLLLASANVTAQIYKAPASSSIFTATNAVVQLAPALTGVVTVGQIVNGSANLAPIPVAQGDRLVMLYTVAGTGVTVAVALTGTASAGITIS